MVWIFFIIFAASVRGHGYLAKPATRDTYRPAGTTWQQYMPIFDSTSAKFVCRNLPISADQLKLVAGQSVTVQRDAWAPHPGPCYFCIGHEQRNQWYKFAEFENCEATMKEVYELKIPNEVPACTERGCVLRWEWHALHLRNTAGGGKIEYYTNCVDISLESSSTCVPDKYLQLPGHVPTDPNQYWYPWQTANGMKPFKHTPPAPVKFICGPNISTSTPAPQPTPDHVRDQSHCKKLTTKKCDCVCTCV